jgi:hypothetical protein
MEYIARDGLTPKVGCRTLNPGTDLHEELTAMVALPSSTTASA